MADSLLKKIQDIALSTEGVDEVVFPGIIPIPKEKALDLEIYINVSFGCKIPEIAFNLQENIKHFYSGADDINIDRVNVHIEGLSFKNKEEEK